MKVPPVESKLFHADRRMADRQTDVKTLAFTYRDFTNVSKNWVGRLELNWKLARDPIAKRFFFWLIKTISVYVQ